MNAAIISISATEFNIQNQGFQYFLVSSINIVSVSRRDQNKRARLLQSLIVFLQDRLECDEIFVQFV